jgi:hypothetical protein
MQYLLPIQFVSEAKSRSPEASSSGKSREFPARIIARIAVRIIEAD